jgi:hypothetical protein
MTPQEQGLGSPTSSQTVNPYVSTNPALQGRMSSLKEAQAAEAQARAVKAQQEAALLQQAQGLGQAPQQPDMQAEVAGLADAMLTGKVSREQLAQLPEPLVRAAMEMANGIAQQAAAPATGLGNVAP